MIGQSDLIERLRRSRARTILITGPAHFGKKTLIRELLSKEESVFEVTGSSNEFRDAVERICTTVRPTSYIIPDLDTRHPTVQNMLLKVIEEPPLNSRFYITASGTILPTIVSRCVSYRVAAYTKEQLASVDVADWCRSYGNSPGQLALLNNTSLSDVVLKLKEFQEKMASNQNSLAWYLKEYRFVDKAWRDTGVNHDVFILIASKLFGERSQAVAWLRQQPNDSSRYVRSQFILKYWLERQGLV